MTKRGRGRGDGEWDRYTLLRGEAPGWVGWALWVFLGAVVVGAVVRWLLA